MLAPVEMADSVERRRPAVCRLAGTKRDRQTDRQTESKVAV